MAHVAKVAVLAHRPGDPRGALEAVIAEEEIHLRRFDDGGRVVEFRHDVDTAKDIHLAGVVTAAS